MGKKTIIIAVVAVVALVIIFNVFLRNGKEVFESAEATMGKVIQEVSETGQVEKGEKVTLNFKTSGKISKIYSKVGDHVEKGELLAKLDTSDLYIHLGEAKANLAVAQANYDKLLAGATSEEITVAETSVENAEIALAKAEQNLIDVQAGADADMAAAYEDAENTLDDAYLYAYNAQNTATDVNEDYFNGSDQVGLKVSDAKNRIVAAAADIREALDEDIETGLSIARTELEKISDALKIIRESCEDPYYKNVVSSTDKTAIDTARSNISTAVTSVSNDQQAISSIKITNKTNINTAEASVSTAQGNLKKAQDELAVLTAGPRLEDIELYEAKIEQAKSQVRLYENTIYDASLRAPAKGQIIEVSKREGEVTLGGSSQDYVFKFIPDIPFDVKVDVYEEDIVKVGIGDKVEISLVAFPGQVFMGTVASIEPAEKLIEGVVYYEVVISFDEVPEGIKPGMSADLTIRTELRDNVLVVPEDAIEKQGGKFYVEVLAGEAKEKREVQIGLEGDNDYIEILSGLSAGDRVVIK